ncbi:MAG: hypothetical protein RML46_10695, partial [Anaerolineae bacterium]|nr:hypothetical protein [Anaerolineae bacterium]
MITPPNTVGFGSGPTSGTTPRESAKDSGGCWKRSTVLSWSSPTGRTEFRLLLKDMRRFKCRVTVTRLTGYQYVLSP